MASNVNVRYDNDGCTLMNQDKMDLLTVQVSRCGACKEISMRDLIAENKSPLAYIPIRSAVNAPEYYGGMRMDGVRGSGDVVCRTENMPCVYNAILANQLDHIKDIIHYAVKDGVEIKVFHDSYMINRFLDLYDQPIPLDQNHAVYNLDIPRAKCDYRNGAKLASFEHQGRDSSWARGHVFAQMEWENEYKAKKREELAALREKRQQEFDRKKALERAAAKKAEAK